MLTRIFDPIIVVPPKEKIYSRLGYAKNITSLNKDGKKNIESLIEEAVSLVELKGAAARYKIEKKSTNIIQVSVAYSFRSAALFEFLKDADEIILMAATAGNRIIDRIKKDTSDHLNKVVVFDAVASELADQALYWVQDLYAGELKRENRILTKNRFSAGYADFLLKEQKKIFDLLELNKIGLSITESFILIPEKSVTAVSGIEMVKK